MKNSFIHMYWFHQIQVPVPHPRASGVEHRGLIYCSKCFLPWKCHTVNLLVNNNSNFNSNNNNYNNNNSSNNNQEDEKKNNNSFLLYSIFFHLHNFPSVFNFSNRWCVACSFFLLSLLSSCSLSPSPSLSRLSIFFSSFRLYQY